ncbi:MAG: SLBB domain-containing protein [candidate division Zixibacteria bacterium]|nr:SLBB domain-containing protein [candidate division Zixibacteria bacterium]
MRKVILILLLVIILVSLSWFREIIAQDLSHLKDKINQSEIELINKYQTAGSSNSETDYYKSPLEFDSASSVARPVQRDYSDSLFADRTAPDSNRILSAQSSRSPQPFEELLPFGLKLFRGTGEISPPDDIAASGDYILGPGDNIIVYLWGRVEKEYNLTVDREGKVIIPKVGELLVWGKTLEEFKAFVRKKMSAVYSEFELNVSLGKIRSIRIYITGEVNKPGAYTVSSLTSLFNALYLAGGPNENGSMRAIRLMREGQCAAEVDLYKFLLEGDNSLDVRLRSGDAIFVPVAGARVAIRGEIRRPAVYELKGGETARGLLELSGRPTAEAHLNRVMLERISGLNEWSVLDLNLNPAAPGTDSLVLKDGDRLTIYSIFEAKKNMVAVFGQVKHPGYYERNDSTRIGDLIERGTLQDYDVYYKRANLFRRYADWRTEIVPIDLNLLLQGDSAQNIVLQDRDSLHIYSIEDVDWDKRISIEGEVKNPGQFKYYDRMSAFDLIFLAGSYTRSASLLRGELARIDANGKTNLLYVNLDEESLRQTFLREDDRLYIRQIPEWSMHRTVTIEGEVLYPGEYMLSGREETLYGLIHRSGGFTGNAFPNGLILQRNSIGKNLQRLQVPKLLEKSSPVVEDSLGNLRREMVYDYELQSVNRVVIDMDIIMASRGEEGNIVLAPGDYIYVPSIPSGISVLGAVGSSGTIKYSDSRNVKHYIKRAGNFVSQSNKDGTQLIRASGEVFSGSGVLNQRVEMGDIIVVPIKIKKERDWTKTFTIAMSATTSILTTVLLIDKL